MVVPYQPLAGVAREEARQLGTDGGRVVLRDLDVDTEYLFDVA